MQKTNVEPLLVGIEDAARIIGLGRSKTYELIREGTIPVLHIGRSVRVPLEELRRYVQRLADEQAEAPFR